MYMWFVIMVSEIFCQLIFFKQSSMAYRSPRSPEQCASPAPPSPAPPHSPGRGVSPIGSPGSPYNESYALSPQLLRQANALQHQLEQFNMVSWNSCIRARNKCGETITSPMLILLWSVATAVFAECVSGWVGCVTSITLCQNIRYD